MLAYLAVVAAASLAFVAGWLTVNGAVVLTVLLLGSLIVLSWIHLGQGRHPVFLFLCTLTLFQGGRLALPTASARTAFPLQVQLMQSDPFSIGRTNEGIVLLCLAVSAICIYGPCRWNYVESPPPNAAPVRQYLPYLYVLFFATLPVQLFKNYRYFRWVQDHGGYNAMYLSHASLASSVPFLVRVIPLVSFPVFVAIFVFETRRKLVYLATFLYFATASLILLMGSRGAVFGLILTLWYVAKVKSNRKTRVAVALLFGVVLMLAADTIRHTRENLGEKPEFSVLPTDFLTLQGISIDVTSTVVAYRSYFAPYAWRYPLNELQNAFVPIDTEHYRRGVGLPYDVPVLLNVIAFDFGAGTGGSYIAESYAIAGIAGVVLISLLLGGGVHLLHILGRSALGLFLVAMTLPDVLLMPRGELLDWFSALLKNAVSFLLLWLGWKIYSLLTSVHHRQETIRPPHSPAPSAQ